MKNIINFSYLLVKDLISKLICKEEERFDVYQTLNHAFFKKIDRENEDDDTCDTENSLLSSNIKEFNKYFYLLNII